MIKQVIVMRTDLNMRKGKMIAQGSHASMKVFFDRARELKASHQFSSVAPTILISLTNKMKYWLESSFTKIVVGCNSEQELFDLKKQADEADIVNAIILDNGNTEFKEEIICPRCKGIGKIYPKRMEINNVIVECDCGGSGKLKINKPTYTCLAIGPDEAEKIDKITGELKLL